MAVIAKHFGLTAGHVGLTPKQWYPEDGYDRLVEAVLDSP